MEIKKVGASPNAGSAAVCADDILSGKLQVATMDLSVMQNREAMLQALNRRQTLAFQLDVTKASHRELLRIWIEDDYRNILVLKREQLHKDLVDAYLYAKFTKNSDAIPKDVAVVRSFSMQHMIRYNYTTKGGETVDYFDKILGIPTSLLTNATFSIKIVDALALVKKIDVELAYVDLPLTMRFITNHINDCLRDVLFKIINDNGLSYYDLSAWYSAITTELSTKLNERLSECGLLVSDVRIIDITIPNNASELLEKQFFALAEEARVKDHENKLEEKSLALYAKKAEIHNKYPQFPITLTEAEKDLALNRYLVREHGKNEAEKLQGEKIEHRTADNEHNKTTFQITRPEKPMEPVKNNTVRVLFAILAVVVAIIGITLAAKMEPKVIGIIVLAVGAVVFTVWGILQRYLLLHGVPKKQWDEYVKALQRYEDEMVAYKEANRKSTIKIEENSVQTSENKDETTADVAESNPESVVEK